MGSQVHRQDHILNTENMKQKHSFKYLMMTNIFLNT